VKRYREGNYWITGRCREVWLKQFKIFATFLLLFPFPFSLFTTCADAAIFDRVVAFVDDQAITLSEFREQYRNTLKVSPDSTEEEVINTMINRVLLLREAHKYRIEGPTKDEIIRDYIDLKVRAFIKISEEEVEAFYKKNSEQFSGRDYEQVRGEIEQFLTEKALNERLKETLKELRKTAYIKVQLQPES
jgi:hypothetical protein